VAVAVLVKVMVGVRVATVTIKGVAVSVAVGVEEGCMVAIAVLSEPGIVGGAYKAVWDASAAAVCTIAVPSCSGGITAGEAVVAQANMNIAIAIIAMILSLFLFITHILFNLTAHLSDLK
jgi:hypothetical protein